jgi:UPF0716 family protein affecting phage T7 exclusion
LQRVLLVAGGFLLIKPGIVTDLIGAALACVVIVAQWPAHRQALAAKAQIAKPASG